MKRILISVLAAVMLAGCSDSSNTESVENIEKYSLPIGQDHTVNAEEIEICTLDRENITVLINKQKNLTAADSMIINIPERAVVLEFTTRTPMIPDWPQDYSGLKIAFDEMFAYWFPDKKPNEDCLYYVGKDSRESWDDEGQQTEFLRKVKDSGKALDSSEGGSIYLEYDEGKGKDDKSGCLECNFGPDPELAGVGTLDRRSFERGREKAIELLPPDSEIRFKLADKEVSVAETVRFFEDSISSAPYPKKPNCALRVAAVEVFENNGSYGFSMRCSKDIGGILTEFSYGDGSFYGDRKYNTLMPSFGYMLRSDEIEMLQCCTTSIIIEDAASYDRIYPFEDAVKRISSELTDEVTFEVHRAELC